MLTEVQKMAVNLMYSPTSYLDKFFRVPTESNRESNSWCQVAYSHPLKIGPTDEITSCLQASLTNGITEQVLVFQIHAFLLKNLK